jgi:cytoskeletal protein CcmA (bactofilin family)
MHLIKGGIMRNIMLILLIPVLIFATEYRTGQTIRVADKDSLYSDLFVGGRYLEVDGYIDGDVYAGCERITINGDVADDVRAAGSEVTVRGTIGDGFLGMGGMVLIEGEIGGDVIAYGGTVRLTPNTIIKGNVYIGCGEFHLDGGRIGGDIQGGADKIYLNGSIKGAVKLEAEEIAFGEQYAAAETHLKLKREIDPGTLKNAPENLEIEVVPHEKFYQSGFFYWAFLAALIVGGLIIAFLKNFVRDYLDSAQRFIGRNLGVGILILVIVPIAVVILLVMVLTIPVGLITLALYLILLYLSSIFTALFAGDYIQKLWHKNGAPYLFLSLLIGLLAVFLLTELPFIGWLIEIAVISFGCGSLILYIWELLRPVNKTA